ncbi:MAG: hypothetical protein L6V80_03205 [Bacteroidales bacterium]|nr:MAG: hypothetical protein L6V80_03205 [Bacteroidales bacterium]
MIRDELIIARSDYARYTSMLNAMPQDERRAMFRNQTWMVGALQLLGRTAEAITKIIDRYFAPNQIPENPKNTGTDRNQRKYMIGKAKIHKSRNKRPPIHHRRVEKQETSRTDIPHQGQSASVQTRYAWRMGHDKSPCADGQEHDPH